MLAVAAAVLVLLLVSFLFQRLLGTDRVQEAQGDLDLPPEAPSSWAEPRTAERAALLERVAAKRLQLDSMVGRTIPIPGGRFQMGDDDGNHNERPSHEAKVAPFELDEIEVTVAAYQLCVGADKCTAPGTSIHCNWGHPDRRNHPVNCIDWNQAQAFCSWAAKRLPTESEWEFASRGPRSGRFPWGDHPPSADLCWQRGVAEAETAQGTCPANTGLTDGQSPFGVRGLADNVREWTATALCAYTRPDCTSTTMVIRGGAWTDTDPLGMRAALRNAKPPAYRSPSLGLRCARDVLERP